jgi:hypothetical protein
MEKDRLQPLQDVHEARTIQTTIKASSVLPPPDEIAAWIAVCTIRFVRRIKLPKIL